ncbi:MAG: outer membrane beta-barrel protein [Hyphomicrobium sp.]|jgi:outer membrane immunogenic protein
MFGLTLSAARNVVAGSFLIVASVAGAEEARPFDWTGFYVGGNLGYSATDAKFGVNPTGGWNTVPGEIPLVRGATGSTLSSDGVIVGVQAGFNQQLGIWVMGLEADVSGTTNESSRTGSPIIGTGITSFSQSAELAWMATVRGRLGVAVDNALIYGTAGAAMGDWYIDMRMAGGPDAATFNRSTVETGWVIGAGFEYAFTEHLSLKAEYLYADFGSVEGNSSFVPTSPDFVNAHKVDLTNQVGRAGINYRF